jgi:hypothetical protein
MYRVNAARDDTNDHGPFVALHSASLGQLPDMTPDEAELLAQYLNAAAYQARFA